MPADAFSRVHGSVLSRLNPAFPPDRWNRIFAWGWQNPEDHVGYGLVTDAGDYVGFAGTIYSDQEVGGRVERFCNITSWYVEEGHRARALSLIMPVLSRRDLTITNLTSSDVVNELFRKLGFVELESQRLRASALRGWGASRGWTEVDAGELSPAEAAVLRDHRNTARSVVLRGPDGVVFSTLYTMGRRRGIRTARIHDFSDPGYLPGALGALGRILATRAGALSLEWDARLTLGVVVPGCKAIPLTSPRLYRSPRLRPEQVRNTYSELPLLNI